MERLAVHYDFLKTHTETNAESFSQRKGCFFFFTPDWFWREFSLTTMACTAACQVANVTSYKRQEALSCSERAELALKNLTGPLQCKRQTVWSSPSNFHLCVINTF